jgi:hypothetical protein
MRDHKISLDDLNQLRVWIESRPNVRENGTGVANPVSDCDDA